MLKKELIKENSELKAKLAGFEDLPKGHTIANNCLYGVKYDEEFALVAKTVAEGFVENAKGLSKLAEILSGSNVEIEAMIKIQGK